MKQIILLLLLTTSGVLSAQGNLQFNRVLSEEFEFDTFDPNYNFQYVTSAFSVPPGKVWKITWMSGGKVNIIDPASAPSNPDNMRIYYKKSIESNYVLMFPSISYTKTDEVLWLGEGDYDLGCYNGSSSAYNTSFKITGIEFNVLP